MQLNGKLILNSDIQKAYTSKFAKAQQFVDSECIRLMVPYTPMLSGQMMQSATRGTVIGSGEIKYNSPYARYQYYGQVHLTLVRAKAKFLPVRICIITKASTLEPVSCGLNE